MYAIIIFNFSTSRLMNVELMLGPRRAFQAADLAIFDFLEPCFIVHFQVVSLLLPNAAEIAVWPVAAGRAFETPDRAGPGPKAAIRAVFCP
ncbi:hypothetical protein [Roseovarius indicus]|uniref:hypothetical protein n=1 Tax=Roseovarius indicus TaxID=540747 RepID=UPI001160C434|nr:hypothetical protein [Roseovarius indicus]